MKLTNVLALMISTAALLACSGSANTTGEQGSGAAGGGGSGSGTVACTVDSGCMADEFCDFPDDQCGAGAPGVCQPRPTFCSDGALIVCGCDGSAAYAGCEMTAGFDTNIDASACTGPGTVAEEVFPCGDRLCRTSTSYCRRTGSDVGGEPDSFSCEPLPSACSDGNAEATCPCLATEPCGDTCADGGDGEITLTCLGG